MVVSRRTITAVVCIVCLSTGFGACIAAPPYPAPWPTAFRVDFTTDDVAGGTPQPGTLYYDWDYQAQRVDHGKGAYECQHFFGVPTCSMVFVNSGTYAMYNDTCCLTIPNIGAPAPNWVAANNLTYVGVSAIGPYKCYQWRKVHNYWSDIESGLPCKFSFPNNPQMDWFFNLSSLRKGSQPPSLFAIAPECKKPCPSTH